MNKQIEEHKKMIKYLQGEITYYHKLIKAEQDLCVHTWTPDGYGWGTEKQICSECEKGRWRECYYCNYIPSSEVQSALFNFPVKHKDGWYYV